MKIERVLFAVKNLVATNIQKHCVVADNAQRHFVSIKEIIKLDNQNVYNMTVYQCHNYLVNEGIISKNCDTDRYCLTSSEIRTATRFNLDFTHSKRDRIGGM